MLENNLNVLAPTLVDNMEILRENLIVLGAIVAMLGFALGVYKGMIGSMQSLWSTVINTLIVGVLIGFFPDLVIMLDRGIIQLIQSPNGMNIDPASFQREFTSLLGGIQNPTEGQRGFWGTITSPNSAIVEGIMMLFFFIVSKVAELVIFYGYLIEQFIIVVSIGFSPLLLSFLLLDATRSIATNFLITLFSVLLWPVGWATIQLLVASLIDTAKNQDILILGDGAEILYTTQYAFFALGASIFMILGTFFAPFAITKMITSGSSFASSVLGSSAGAVGGVAAASVGIGAAAATGGGSAVAGAGAGAGQSLAIGRNKKG